jgi:predicted dithiol-disulfide oxidoreductase (DUF899 family)
MHRTVISRTEWIEARMALMDDEREMMALMDRVAEKRRSLPWTAVGPQYRFSSPDGVVGMADLFGGCSQLFMKHFMLAPGQAELCVGCSLEADHVNGLLPHLENNDVAYVAVARAPIDEIEVIRQRMGWDFRWVSSYGSLFNYDFHVSFTPEEMVSEQAFYNFRYGNPGLEDMSGNSVFHKDDAGNIHLTYSSFGRGSEDFLGIYRYLDVVPHGRNEHGPHCSLTDWARPHDSYGEPGTVAANGRYYPSECPCSKAS